MRLYQLFYYVTNIIAQKTLYVKEFTQNMSEIIKNESMQTNLKTSDFYYDIPDELIAQVPSEKRDGSRLMVLGRESGEITHKHFYDIADYLKSGDVLVLNRSRVMPARLFGKREGTNADIEVLLLKRISPDTWETIVRPGKKCKPSVNIIFGNGILCATVKEVTEDGNRIISFKANGCSIDEAIHKIGEMPLPPYITSREAEKERYQTVYSKEEGSAAAPTAGLHFTTELLKKIEEKGVKIVTVLLHVGLGTFRPVKEKEIKDHVMHSEWFSVSKEAADIINKRSGRLIAVGTTCCRVLESIADVNGRIKEYEGETAIFIYPGYRFKAVEGLITNFHLPESTLIMLVSAFAGRENILNAYNTAVREKYRFFSFGDAMFIQ